MAVALATLVVLAVLILTAFVVVLIALLPLGLLPLLPLVVRDQPLLAVGAVRDEDGSTRVTVHGQAPARLTAALDLFLSQLPVAEHAVIPDPGNTNGHGGRNGTVPDHSDDQPIRTPERTAAE